MINQPESVSQPTLEQKPLVIDWYRSLPWWPLLSQSVTIGWRLSHLLVASLGVLLTLAGWNLGFVLFKPVDMETSAWYEAIYASHGSDALMPTALARVTNSVKGSWWSLPSAWSCYVTPILGHKFPMPPRNVAYVVFVSLWTALLWSWVGGLLCRRSVVRFATGSFPGWGESIRFMKGRWTSIFWALTMPWLAAQALIVIPAGLGLIARLGTIGFWLASGLTILLIVVALGIGWTVVVTVFAFPMTVAGVVTEKNGDAFDGLSQSVAFLLQRPSTFALGIVAALFVSAVAFVGLDLAIQWGGNWFLGALAWGSGFTVFSGPDAAGLFPLIPGLFQVLKQGLCHSMLWTSAAAIYLALRRDVDHVDMDDIDLGQAPEAVPVRPMEPPPAQSSETPGTPQSE